MKKQWLLALLAVFTGSVFAATASNSSTVQNSAAAVNKIAVVDVRTVLQKLAEVKGIDKDLSKQFNPRRDDIMKLQQDLKAEVDDLNKNASVLADADKQKRSDKIDADKRNLTRMQQDFQDDLAQAQQRAMAGLMQQVQAAVSTIAKADGYTIVLPKESVPYVSDNLDITTRVLEAIAKEKA